jgi:glutamyl-Q tRNA(Asp) synthetase
MYLESPHGIPLILPIMSSSSTNVRGRFAPSPTGPLHFGSLVAAVGSYLSVKSQNGEWLVRMEDLDPPREMPGAANDILRTLAQHGFEWDGEVMYQSRRSEAYETALEMLRQNGALYACACTRKEIGDSSLQGIEGPVYPGTCRAGLPAGRAPRALRVRTDGAVIAFTDRVQGAQRSRLETEIGDFVVKRADGFHAYQLAVVVDDAEQGITEIVRGADLLGSTARQIHLQQLLDFTTPVYAHLPAALNAAGEKLSKQTFAAPLSAGHASENLWRALAFLGQQPLETLRHEGLATLWAWALANWRLEKIPAAQRRPVEY